MQIKYIFTLFFLGLALVASPAQANTTCCQLRFADCQLTCRNYAKDKTACIRYCERALAACAKR
ncbi:Hypothetical predicted protein [Mytilus galloprovincialis]|uniref:Uncharacterized protein n=1 Tax=Mytilus galloprovincialis TaxID=29158 RepID=A0A8B6GX55_MYTGA|nr:Hypothetical predicted protein [Mytilus galloprovincialis]